MRRALIICLLMSFVSAYPQSLKITGYEGPVTEGCSLQLQAALSPANAAYNTYTWSSTNTAVATVNGNGLVTAVSEGTATIKCVLSAEYSGTQYFAPPSPITATCAITVRKKIATDAITFADATVKSLCVGKWDTNGDQELSYAEAAAVTDIGSTFYAKNISTFNELSFFTNLSSIGEEAFRGCSSLTTVVIPESVTTIGAEAFRECTSLTSLTIPKNVSSVGLCLFAECGALETVVVESGNITYDSRNNCNAVIETASNTLVVGCRNTTIPNNVTCIGDWAFRNSTGLASMTIPNSVTSIGYYAFADCHQLVTIAIPNSVTSINDAAFSYCTSLSSVELSSSMSEINASLFENCSSLTSLSIPNSVSFIGSCAFKGCTGLTSIIIPNSVTTIINNAFEGCSGMTTVTIPNRLTSIESLVFKGCSGLTSITIPNSVKSIKKGAFSGCTSLTTVSVPSSVTSIGEYAFSNCSSLASVTISNGVKSIDEYAFSGCRNLISLMIPKSLTTIDQHAFNNCSSIETIVVEDGNTKYDSRNNCNAIILTASNTLVQGCKSTVIPNSVTTIDLYAFYGCSGLTSVSIPNSVTTIPVWGDQNGTTAFCGCNNLETIIVESGNTTFDSRDNCNALINTSSNSLLLGCKNTVIPNTVTSIKGYAFWGRSGLTSVTIPYSVTSIGDYSFQKCTDLTSVIIPSSVTSIGDYAFDGCNSLISVTVGISTPLSIKSNVFPSRTKATLYVPMGSKAAYSAAKYWKDFKEIVEVTNINFADAEVKRICVENWDTNGDGDLSFGEATAVTDLGQVFKGNNVITSFDELQYFTGLTSIYNYAFDNCKNLIKVIIPYGVKTIETGAFQNCNNLTGITLPNTIETIMSAAFNICYQLDNVILPNSLLQIGEGAFSHCTSLHAMVIPQIVSSIEGNPFSDCSNLKTMVVKEGNPYYDSRNNCNAIIRTEDNCLVAAFCTTVIPNTVTTIGHGAFFQTAPEQTQICIPQSVTSIEQYAFSFCSSLESIVIPSSVSDIAYEAFSWETALSSIVVEQSNTTYDSRGNCNAIIKTATNELVTGCKTTIIPSSVTSIAYGAFWGCKEMTSIIIPDKVVSIGEGAFYYNTGLTEIELPSTVTTIGKKAFMNCSSIAKVTSLSTSPSTFGLNAFKNISPSCVLFVPYGTRDIYIAAGWTEDIFKGGIVEMEKNNSPVTIEVTDIATMDDAIYIEPISAGIGSDTKIEICLKNAHVATAYVFDLVLPDGVTVATNSNGKYIDALSNRHDGHSRTFNYKGNNTYSLATISGNSEELAGNDGAIRLLTLHIADEMPEGTYAINITNASYSMPDATLVTLENTTSSITVKRFILGDVNGNDEVDIGDAVSVVNYLVGKEVQTFMEISADTNKNGQIDIGDAVIIVNYLVGEVEKLSRKHKIWDKKEPQ